jgi:hypothetical protein
MPPKKRQRVAENVVDFVAFGRHRWFLQWEHGGWNSGGQEGLGTELVWELKRAKAPIAELALGSDDNRWWYKLADGTTMWFGLDRKLNKKLESWPAEFVQFFGGDGYFAKFEDGTTVWQNAPVQLAHLANKYSIERVYSDGAMGWLAMFDDGSWQFEGLPAGLCQGIKSRAHIKAVALSPYDSSYFAMINSRLYWESPDTDFDVLMNPAPTWLDPSAIYFTSKSISRWFQSGHSIEHAIAALHHGDLDVSDFPPIRVAFHKQGWWSLDNRRLYCFQAAGLQQVPVRAVNVGDLLITGDGMGVKLRN